MATMEDYAKQPREQRMQRLTRSADELAAAIEGQSDVALVGPNPDRVAEERQYLRNDTGEAVAAFRKRRTETLETFGKLTRAQWEKGGIHPVRGRITIDDFLSLMAWHDDNHLDQLTRALQGRA